MEENRKYNIVKDGIIVAVRLYTIKNGDTYADMIFALGGQATINWTNIEQRNEYMRGINGYTLFYDEREKMTFDEWKQYTIK